MQNTSPPSSSIASLYQQAYVLHRNGQFAEAEALYKQVIALQENHADAHHMLGLVCYQTNRTTEAIEHISKALSIAPRLLDYLNNLGLALRANKQAEDALKSFQQAILLQPKDLDVQLNIANTLLELQRFEEAATYYRRVLKAQNRQDLRSALAHCLSNLGNQAHAAAQYARAESYFLEAIVHTNTDAAFYYNLGNAQRELGKPAEAAKQYLKAIQYAPDDADAYNNLGNVQRELGQLDLAIASYEQALKINPKLYHAKVHLIHQRQHICDWDNLDSNIKQVREWINTQPQAQISPFAFLAMPGTTAEEQKQCANNWVKNRYSELIKKGNDLNFHKSDSHGKMRIGYLSADFRLHPLAFLISELIELHDRAELEIHAFSYGVNDKSSARTRLEKAVDYFHDIRNLPDLDAAKKIHECEIDILVDLTGFTQTSRSGIAALRPAPINVNWLGFPGTMGSFDDKSLFDYILTDNFICPPEYADDYAESLAVLPDCYQPNDRQRPIGNTPSREACGLPDNVFVFCSFNQSYKITPDVFAVWMRLLNAVPDSVLWLLDCNQWAKDNLLKEAAKLGITSDRIIFSPRVAIADHLPRHAHADLFLDTLPYNAHTTCSDALWMGVPVLTCAGETFASRVAGSLLTTAALAELITYNLQDYETKALQLASNPAQLLKIKEKLLRDKTDSRLFDTARFAKSLEETYQVMWNQKIMLKS